MFYDKLHIKEKNKVVSREIAGHQEVNTERDLERMASWEVIVGSDEQRG